MVDGRQTCLSIRRSDTGYDHLATSGSCTKSFAFSWPAAVHKTNIVLDGAHTEIPPWRRTIGQLATPTSCAKAMDRALIAMQPEPSMFDIGVSNGSTLLPCESPFLNDCSTLNDDAGLPVLFLSSHREDKIVLRGLPLQSYENSTTAHWHIRVILPSRRKPGSSFLSPFDHRSKAFTHSIP